MAVTQQLILTQQAQSVSGNSSEVHIRWTSTQTGGSYNLTPRTAYLYYSINGQPETAVQLVYTLPLQSTAVLYDGVLTVPHNGDGTAKLTVRTWLNTNISAGTLVQTKTIELTPIARQSQIRADDGVIGGRSVIRVDRKNHTYTHTIAVEFGSVTGYLDGAGVLWDLPQRVTAVQIPFLIPEQFYGQIPNAPKGVCKLICTTYQGDQVIGAPEETTFTVYADEASCCPVVTGQLRDINPQTVAVTGDERILVRYVSCAEATVQAQPRKGATIASMWLDEVQIPEETVRLSAISEKPARYRAVDSRGFAGVYPWEGEWIPYVRLSLSAQAERTDPTSGNVRLTVSGTCFDGLFNPDTGVGNTLELSCSANAEAFVPIEGVVAENGRYSASVILSGLRYDRIHTLTVRASDRVMTAEKSLMIKKGTPVFDWGEQDFRFHVPVQVEGELSAQNLRVGGKNLLDMLYPVGAVYISATDHDPAGLFGGQWVCLQDRFLLGAGGQYPAGTTGGAAEHVLTVEELPAHSHSISGRVNGEAGAGNGAWDYSGNWPAETNALSASTGGSMPHNNMPPYLAVYMWQRIA